MRRTIFVASLMIWAGLCAHSYGYDPLIFLKPGCEKCQPHVPKTIVPEASVFCKVTCDCVTKGGKPRYWKKVCKTFTKAVAADCGCNKKVCKALVTQVSYQLVLFPKHYNPDELVCSCKQPPGHEICETLEDCCRFYKQKRCYCDPTYENTISPGGTDPSQLPGPDSDNGLRQLDEIINPPRDRGADADATPPTR